jgi:hypothetical protein
MDSDSDEEFNQALIGNQAVENKNAGGMMDFASLNLEPEIKNVDNRNKGYKVPKTEDLIVEDNWNFEGQDDNQPQQPVKTKSTRQELLESQKNKLANKKYITSDNHNNINYQNRKKQNDGPGLDSIYENQVQPRIDKYDAELDGEIQHESLKKKLDEQRANNRVEFTAANPADLLKNKQNENQDLGRANMVDMDGAQAEYGNYDDQKLKKKKKKKKKKVQLYDEDGNQVQSAEYAQLDVDDVPIITELPRSATYDQHKVGERAEVRATFDESPVGAGAAIAATFEQPKYEEYDEDGAPTDPSTVVFGNNDDEGEGDKKKKKKKKKKHHDEEQKYDEDGNPIETPEGENDENGDDVDDEEKRKKRKEKKKDKRNKRKDEISKIKNAFMEKLISPFTEVEELIRMFTQPLPKEVGILECTILRNKSGFNYWNPKYSLVISDGERFL